MPGPTILDESKILLTEDRVAGSIFATNNVRVHLLVPNTTYDHTADRATLIAQDPVFSGYAAQNVAAWGLPVLTTDFHALSIGSTVVFTNTSGADSPPIYGWWYEDVTHVKALLVGKFASPIIIPAGQAFTFTPTWQGTGEFLTE